MVGLLGMIGESNERLLNRMCASMKHEKWYRCDKYVTDEAALARIHLGTFNPEPQPIFDRGKEVGIFMDGEIYGYGEGKRKFQSRGHDFKVYNDAELLSESIY